MDADWTIEQYRLPNGQRPVEGFMRTLSSDAFREAVVLRRLLRRAHVLRQPQSKALGRWRVTMSRRKYSATAPLDPFIERELAKRGPKFRAEVDAAYAEMLLEHELAVLRDEEGITQAELARRLGVSQPVVARFESGNKSRGVEVGTIVRYAAALGYEFVTSFKKIPVAKQARALAVSVRLPTKRSKPVPGTASSVQPATKRSKPVPVSAAARRDKKSSK
jgi:transcriptional regulator with XRE-family HTH domain